MNIAVSLVTGAAGGIGGSVASIFVLSLDGKFKDGLSDEKVLAYLATGVVSGFLGFSLLKTVAGNWHKRMEAKVDRLEEKTTELEAAQQALKEAQVEIEFVNAIVDGRSYLHEDVNEDLVKKKIDILEEGLKKWPDRRRAIIVLGNLYGKKLRNVNEAIKVLAAGLEAISKSRPTDVKDVSDIHFNIACYYCDFVTAAAQPEKSQDKKDAMERAFLHLRRSIVLWPANKTEAKEATMHPELDPIREETEFKTIVG